MRKLNALVPAIAAAALAFGTAVPSSAQVSLGVQVGPAPVCPYGYYGSEWFTNGVFIGAGPWYRGGHDFYGHVDRHYDPHYGYHGAYPGHEEHFDSHRDFHEFHGNSMRDGRGHEREH